MRRANLPSRAWKPPSSTSFVLGGGGHVGLPLSLAFARAGLRVGILDIAETTIERIGRGEMPFLEAGADELLAEIVPTGRLELTTSADMLDRTRVVIVVVGTPIDEFLNPSMTIFQRTVDQIAPHLQPVALLVLRSTVYPGTTEYVAAALADQACEVDVAFCPERIAEGHALEELATLPQIIGADNEAAGDRAEALFRNVTPHIIRTSTKEAEFTKLFTNAWRYIKFAAANQFFEIANDAGVDYTNVLRAIRQDYPRARDLPGPGLAAGPCLLKDTMQLAAFTSDHFGLGQSAMQVNEGLPAYIVSAMEKRYGNLRRRTVGLLGMAFKAESDDVRSSLSYKLRKLLFWSGARVFCTDPYVTDPRLLPLEKVLADSEILVIGAPHQAYRQADLRGRKVVDIWGVVDGIDL
jgi:UDP-N-acetyl-D-mannosaminuronic acid dehydrogenase